MDNNFNNDNNYNPYNTYQSQQTYQANDYGDRREYSEPKRKSGFSGFGTPQGRRCLRPSRSQAARCCRRGREMELVSEPVTAKASVGWEQGGEDILEEVKITSFVLRRFSADIVCDNPDALFDYINGQPLLVVMEDGTEIELLYGPHYYALTPIALDQVAYVRLADGTKLEAPQ